MDPLRNVYIIAFIFFVFTAFMSAGFFHEDEHFQLVEYANFKMGNIPAEELPWEYEEQMRPTFQVAIVYSVFSALQSLHLLDPFNAATILRLIAAMLSFIALYSFFQKYKSELSNQSSVKWFLWLSFFLWYVPFISVRFSSESFATSFMLLAISNYSVSTNKRSVKFLLVGIFMGLSFICRYQMGFMVFGMGLWMLFIKKEKFRIIGLVLAGFLISMAIGLISDHWFYGKWVLSAYNYFYQNLIENKAAGFGTSPVWFYALNTPLFVFPVFGIIIIPCLVIFFIKYPKHIFTWLLIPFIVIHHLIGHKEMRFLFPIAPFIPFVIVIVLEKFSKLKRIRFLKYPFVVLNILFLIIMSCKPAYDNMGVFKYIYRKAENKPVYFISHQTPFRMYLPEIAKKPYRKGYDLTMHFYQRKGFYPHAVKDIQVLDSILSVTHQKSILVARTMSYLENYEPELSKAGIKNRVVYNTYHSYFSRFNYGNWMSIEDVGVWTIVEVEK
jgi:phosphatidylinositol glycan class B